MPTRLHKTLTVRVEIEVDGHTFRFTEQPEVTGSRYHGTEPPPEYKNLVLERNIRRAVAAELGALVVDVHNALARLYPVAGDQA